ncbi:dihydroxyacetone kinase subunit DhaL [Kribbella jejuensis]|uniref:Dihydroxyacetone kinase DhaL subunit n=1 Tax=Kribbella jejuensis TaxID=236068 RepID=A0A542EA20_9ACTN|nr:dihydroxyacetone kinase subunit DhaL [Kribbella jejuensis]TQJ12172.1 dihydroxyacetone kinase DhaL subunit [Kribbella jejuensis]
MNAALFDAWLRSFARLVAEHEDELTRLDSAIGDADHGANMNRGLAAVVGAIDPNVAAGPLLANAGMTLISTVGGAAGPLFGTFFLRMGNVLDDVPFATALRAGLDGVVQRGKAEANDKTMYDALAPAVEAVEKAAADGLSLPDALAAASAAADEGCAATIPLVARKGRASYLGERSVGHQDPGATTVTLLFRSLRSSC